MFACERLKKSYDDKLRINLINEINEKHWDLKKGEGRRKRR